MFIEIDSILSGTLVINTDHVVAITRVDEDESQIHMITGEPVLVATEQAERFCEAAKANRLPVSD